MTHLSQSDVIVGMLILGFVVYVIYQLKRGQPIQNVIHYSSSWLALESRSLAACELVRHCAFFAPDDIMEEIFTKNGLLRPVRGGQQQGDKLFFGSVLGYTAAYPNLWSTALAEAFQFGFLQRDVHHDALRMPLPVQRYIRSQMNAKDRLAYLTRVAYILTPENIHIPTEDNEMRQRLLPHQIAVIEAAEQDNVISSPLIAVLNSASITLRRQKRYEESELLLQRALAMSEMKRGGDHPMTVTIMLNMSALYADQGRFAEAVPYCCRCLFLHERQIASDPEPYIIALSDLVAIYNKWEQHGAEEFHLWRLIPLLRKHRGDRHLTTAIAQGNLAYALAKQGQRLRALKQWKEAEPTLRANNMLDESEEGEETEAMVTFTNAPDSYK